MPPRCSWCGREAMTHPVPRARTEDEQLHLCMDCMAKWKVKDEQERIARAETDELPAVELEASGDIGPSAAPLATILLTSAKR